MDEELMEKFHHEVMHSTSYMGVPTLKNPVDAWVYQEIIYETKPDIIIEIGNRYGGSTLYLLDCMRKVVQSPYIYAIDIDHSEVRVEDPNIRFIQGDATDPSVLHEISLSMPLHKNVMVIEDSSHTYINTLTVLNLYSNFVSPGCYFIVEDTIINHGLRREAYDKTGCSYDAVKEFLVGNKNFKADRSRERFGITHNPNGFLRRKK